MHRVFSWAVAILLVSAANAFAVVADWQEEMEADPALTNWLDGLGVDSNGSTWVTHGNLLKLDSAARPNPLIGLTTYTYEFRARLLDLPATNPGLTRSQPINVYMSDNVGSMGRSGFSYGILSGEYAYEASKPGVGDIGVVDGTGEGIAAYFTTLNRNRVNQQPVIGDIGNGVGWNTYRIVQDQGANKTSFFVNGVPFYQDSPGATNPSYGTTNTIPWTTPAGGLNGPHHRMEIGSQDSPASVRAEFDYLRIVKTAVPIGEAIIPISATCGGDVSGSTAGVPDGTTDGADLAYLYNHWGAVPVGTLGDIAGTTGPDGVVDGADVGKVYNCWAQADGAPASVPEPASIGILGLGLVGLLAARRR